MASHPLTSAILPENAVRYLQALHEAFEPKRLAILTTRQQTQNALNHGQALDFANDEISLRGNSYRCPPIPADLQDRRVEITGPVERKMIINALNSGAQVFMADFEDSCSPTWDNILSGQQNLIDAIQGTITFFDNEKNKEYRLADTTATLIVRPRGWHLVEKHFTVAGSPISASLFDAGLYLFHNALELQHRGSGAYLYLPKMQAAAEAALWAEVLDFSCTYLTIPRHSLRVTIMVETLPAIFCIDAMLYALRDYACGMNCGRWDYLFSAIKTLQAHHDLILGDRSQLTMTLPCMQAYTSYVIDVCHRRGVHAIGGMAAQIPIKNDPAANAAALDKVRADKLREVQAGHDGTWVAHPALVPLAQEIFTAAMPTANQIQRRFNRPAPTATQLLDFPSGQPTEAGLRTNLRVGVTYLTAWLAGNGCVPINNLMEDAATAEVSRAQVWQWLHRGATLADGRAINPALVQTLLNEECASIPNHALAHDLFLQMVIQPTLTEFLTLPAYEVLTKG